MPSPGWATRSAPSRRLDRLVGRRRRLGRPPAVPGPNSPVRRHRRPDPRHLRGCPRRRRGRGRQPRRARASTRRCPCSTSTPGCRRPLDTRRPRWHSRRTAVALEVRAGPARHDDGQSLLNRASARLGQRLGSPAGVPASYHVVNTCSWARTDVVRIFVPESSVPLEQPVVVHDARTGAHLQHEERPQVNDDHRDAGRFLLVRVDDVPPAGSVRLDIRIAEEAIGDAAEEALLKAATGWNPQAAPSGRTRPRPPPRPTRWPNRCSWRTSTSPSAWTSPAPASAPSPTRPPAANWSVTTPSPASTPTSTTATPPQAASTTTPAAPPAPTAWSTWATAPWHRAALIARRSTATAETITYETRPAGANRVRTTLTLPRGVARLDIENRVDKDATTGKESAYFAFPFALGTPTVRMEASGGATGTGLPVVPGSALHMRAVRRWITLRRTSSPSRGPARTRRWFSSATSRCRTPRSRRPWATTSPPPSSPGSTTTSGTRTSQRAGLRVHLPLQHRLRRHGRRSRPEHGRRLEPPPARRARQRTGVGGCIHLPGLRRTGDPRVRLVGATTPAPGRVLLRLQSFAEEPVACPVRARFPVLAAHRSNYLGTASTRLPLHDGEVTLDIPALGTAAVLLERH